MEDLGGKGYAVGSTVQVAEKEGLRKWKRGRGRKWEGRGCTSEEEGERCLQMTERDERDCAD